MFLLDLLAPPRCAACQTTVAAGRAFCVACAVTVTRSHGSAAFLYGGALRTAVTRWKFDGALGVGTALTRLFATELAPRVPADAVLVPVPLHPRRLAERGFNPAALLALALARVAKVRVELDLVRRVRDTPKQSGLNREARLVNLAAAFLVTRKSPTAARIVLVDDVTTTGSTLQACREALGVAAGAAVLARAP